MYNSQRKSFKHFISFIERSLILLLSVSFRIHFNSSFKSSSSCWDNWNGISLFWDPLSLPWIVGFRHYFGDLESFQNSSNIPFWGISFYQRIIRMVDSCVIHFWFDRKSFTNSLLLNLKLAWIGLFQFLYRKFTYKVVPIY